MILDEPTRGVDVGAKKEIYQLINQFKADGLSIILVSSEMPEVLGMSDRIIVMHEGHLKVYQLPEATRGARGRPIVNLLPLEQDERITAILPVTEFEEGVKVFMATANGTVKKTVLTEFNRLRTAGK